MGGASGRRAMREVGVGGAGEADSKEWSGESRDSNATLDAGMEEGEGEHSPLRTLQWGRQESGARGLRGDARAGRSDGGKVPTVTADGGGRRDAMGRKKTSG